MKMTRLIFQIDPFFKRSKSGSIWGTIYFENGDGQAFPDRGWTDLVAAFLRGWMSALVRIAHGTSSTERVVFYDGPMQVELNAKGRNLVEIIFFHREEPQVTAEEEMLHLLSGSARVSETLLTACEERDWYDADTAAVMSLLADCRDLVARYESDAAV